MTLQDTHRLSYTRAHHRTDFSKRNFLLMTPGDSKDRLEVTEDIVESELKYCDWSDDLAQPRVAPSAKSK